MLEIHIKGKILLPDDAKKTFMSKFSEFLNKESAKFSGSLNMLEFDDVEIIEEISENKT